MIEILVEGMTDNPGGKESYIINIFQAFNKKSYKFTFIAYDTKIAYEDILKTNGAEVVYLPPRYRGIFRHRNAIKDLITKRHFDVVWAHKTTLSDCDILYIAKKNNIPVRIIHSHSSHNMGGTITLFLHTINKYFLRNWANEFFACSEPAARWFFGNRPFRFIKNGIFLKKFKFDSLTRSRIRQSLSLEGCFVVGHIGRFGKEKNHKKLISVFKIVKEQCDNAKLLLCGDGEERKNIENQIRNLGLEKDVLLLGTVNNIYEILQAMDIFVMPSFFEGLPFALLEAQASGLKCIVSDTISRESDILSGNHFLPLSMKNEAWAEYIMKEKAEYDRSKGFFKMKGSGYDISDCLSEIAEVIDSHIYN